MNVHHPSVPTMWQIIDELKNAKRHIKKNNILSETRKQSFCATLREMIRTMQEDSCIDAIERVRTGRVNLPDVCYTSIGSVGSHEVVMELISLTKDADFLNDLLLGACGSKNNDCCDAIILAGATYCDNCDNERHPQLHHWDKFILIQHIGLERDVLGLIAAAFCECMPDHIVEW
jgi:hypothetical protein